MLNKVLERDYRLLVSNFSSESYEKNLDKRIKITIFSFIPAMLLIIFLPIVLVLIISIFCGLIAFKLPYWKLRKTKNNYLYQLKVSFPLFALVFTSIRMSESSTIQALKKVIGYIDNEYLKAEVIRLYNALVLNEEDQNISYYKFAKNVNTDLSMDFIKYLKNIDNKGYRVSNEQAFLRRILETYNTEQIDLIEKVTAQMVVYAQLIPMFFVGWILAFVSVIFILLMGNLGVL